MCNKCNSPRWEDISLRQPGEYNEPPNRMQIQTNRLCITIRFFRGVWSSDSGGVSTSLKAKSYKEAQHEAFEIAQDDLEKKLADLQSMKLSTL